MLGVQCPATVVRSVCTVEEVQMKSVFQSEPPHAWLPTFSGVRMRQQLAVAGEHVQTTGAGDPEVACVVELLAVGDACLQAEALHLVDRHHRRVSEPSDETEKRRMWPPSVSLIQSVFSSPEKHKPLGFWKSSTSSCSSPSGVMR